LVAGGTGFVGSWLISTFEYMNLHFKTNFEVISLSRKISPVVEKKFKHTKFVLADIGSSSLDINLRPDLVINSATPSASAHGNQDPKQILNASIEGTKRLLELSLLAPNTTFLNLSSGIVAKHSKRSSVDRSLANDSYIKGKKASEELVNNFNASGSLKGKNLRLFAFAGPGIALNEHFAVGNFISDAIKKQPININGNPMTRRSYLYPTDLVINILRGATNHQDLIQEIGSRNPVTMRQLANLVNEVTGNSGINQSLGYGVADEYFPNSESMIVHENVELQEAVLRWKKWLEAPNLDW
jgi:nucleoside-diphosphate-sugar epimerase